VNLRERLRYLRRSLNPGFFWQLFLAFMLVALMTGVGVFLAGQRAVDNTREFFRENPSLMMARVWAARLGEYYALHGSWEGVQEVVVSAPFHPMIQNLRERRQSFVLVNAEGVVVAADHPSRLGSVVPPAETSQGISIVHDNKVVGTLIVSFPERIYVERRLPLLPRLDVRQQLLVSSAYLLGLALLLSLLLSHSISHPLMELTEATRAVAQGDLEVRVSTGHAGEFGELAEAFNSMATELQRADELRRNLTADIAHELRTPLSVIRGKLEGIIDGVYPANEEHLAPILEETAVLTQLVEDLRLLAQAEAGQLHLARRPTDVGDLLRDAYVNFTPQAGDQNLTLILDLPEALPPVDADWRRISQVLGNLIVNAFQHTPSGGQVTLSARPQGEEVAISVRDTGVGIPREELPYIFERFWRGDRARVRTEYGSSGLGLAIVKQIVELHGGQVRVASEPGKGATFTFTLPHASSA